MGKRKTLKRDLLKCRGFNVAPCFSCKRFDKTAAEQLAGGFSTYRGQNNCEHFI